MITIKAFDGGEFDAYLALPASGYGPGIVVLQEIFGVNSFMRGVADWYAAHTGTPSVPERIQLMWPDEQGRLPDDQDCDPRVRDLQTPKQAQ